MEMDREALIGAWRDCIRGADKSWVLFAQGTCVILMQPEPDVAAQARALLAEWGAVQAGTPAGDFGVITLDNGRGWVVTGHHPDILTFVPREELEEDAGELLVGMHGRSRRGEDAEALAVIHVEDRR
ncbi:TPA: hypothetical protein OTR99_003714 [Pseudomonas aeruginosa]|uniref:hypothetical protein n=1 Tax=Pseudomonas aeruginosa TaxID=287 RepID=UPI000EB4F5F1|nr:hypothetical protein [Pseudomonas aeruginosa]MCT4933094.1 hypothetical protein [Pseudomonas aeruginosa]HBN8511447.1 hypothetical protein [Pseudomonas aeruginosa]HCL3646203.1 hypothetical protein [Pseudomonas aeruginosa]HCT2657484.1 hypothetical protein [Pseudomonas aeruginosa]HDQ4744187.1 hypothetical protein [Pseudomonas aeruginosa]